MKRAILGSIAAAALAATPLWAQDTDLFGKLDKNADGVVTADEVEGDAKGVFERALRRGDKNGDKQLTKDEFTASLQETDAPRQPLGQGAGPGRPGGGQFNPREIFARQDANKDGKVGKDEAQGFLKEAFERLDANSDGAISEEELARMAGRRPDGAPGAPGAGNREQVNAMFERADANKDGKLTKDEIPEDRRERFAQFAERLGIDSIDKEQFARFVGMMQGGRPGEPGRPGFGPPGMGRPPLFVTLDADNDGELSASEIEASTKALLKLDKNSDGKLSREELFPGSPDGPPRDRPAEGRPGEGRPDARRPADQPGERRPAEGRPGFAFNPEEFQARVKDADKNGDGKLTKEEAPPMLKERFDRIDANSDGVLDETELRPLFQRRRDGGDRPQGRPDAPRRQ